MDIESFRAYCLAKPGVSEGFPFDEKTLVFKVLGKLFALTNIEEFERVNLKCDPERAQELRADFDAIQPGYHMNKQHWNTVTIKGVPNHLLLELIDHSYDLIVSKLTKKQQHELRT